MRDFRGLLKIAGIEKVSARDWEGMPGKPDGSTVPTGGKSDGLFLPAYGTYMTYTLKDHILSALTGTERLYHVTPEENVQSILENGLLTSKSLDPGTYTSQVRGNNDVAKNKVFAARWQPVAKSVAHQQKSLGKTPKTLKIRIPYDDLKDLGYTKYNPEYISFLRYMETIRGSRKPLLDKTITAVNHGPGIGSFGTRVFKHDIPPEYIVGSQKFRNGAMQTLKNFPRYVAKHPVRFAGGAAGAALGIASLYTLGRNAVRKFNRFHNNAVAAPASTPPAPTPSPAPAEAPTPSVPKSNKGTAIAAALGSTAVATALLLALMNRRKKREKKAV